MDGLRAGRGHGAAGHVSAAVGMGGESGERAAAAAARDRPRAPLSTSLFFFFPPHPHSKDAWAAPTKGVGSWTSDTATARFEARHDAALKALRRPRIDE